MKGPAVLEELATVLLAVLVVACIVVIPILLNR
jgi:hypothetical protein